MILAFLISLLLLFQTDPSAQVPQDDNALPVPQDGSASPVILSDSEESIDISGIIFEHIGDEYEWHITEWKGKPIAFRCPASW